jgi:pantetheine-phosphate adenylyltransferase
MKRAVCPGTFDPVTAGHLDIIRRASEIFDEVVVAVAVSPDKGGGPLFSNEERQTFIRDVVADLPGVSVRGFDTLLVNLAREVGAQCIIKGLRAVSDFEREFQMAQFNYRLDEEIETIFIMAVPEYMFLSSSAVKEIAGHGGSVKGLVPDAVADSLAQRLGKAR